jgi:hypothetical protein
VAETTNDPDADQPDMVGKLVDAMLKGKTLATKQKGGTIALGNHNEIQKDENTEEEKNQEETVKKTAVAGKQKNQEERNKVESEARRKKDGLQRSKIHAEEAGKQFDDDLRTSAEQSKKKGKEEGAKSGEASQKKVEEAAAKRTSQQAAEKRADALLDAQSRAGESQLKAVAQLEKMKAMEAIKKANDEASLKLAVQQRQFKEQATKAKMAQAKREADFEEKQKREAVARQKEHSMKDEQGEKARKLEQEQSKKQAEHIAEQNLKKFQQTVVGTRCQCTTVRVTFDQMNQWHACPDGTLITGFNRGGDQLVSALYYYQCCKPCRDDGKGNKEAVMQVSECSEADWSGTFGRPYWGGWAVCPDNTYIQGFYKADTNFLSSIKKARCCKISGSRSRAQCQTLNWWSFFDYAGWKIIGDNQFLVGIYKSGGEYLYNFESPQACTFWGY